MLKRFYAWLLRLVFGRTRSPLSGPSPASPKPPPPQEVAKREEEGARVALRTAEGWSTRIIPKSHYVAFSDGKTYVVAGDGSLRRLDKLYRKAQRIVEDREGKQ